MNINGIEIPDELLLEAGWTLPEPKPEPKPLQFDGTPVWAYVSHNLRGYDDAVRTKKKRHVVAHDCNGFSAIKWGRSNTESTDTSLWPYAWEIPEDEA